MNVEELRFLLASNQCLGLQAEREKTIAERYSEYGLKCFEQIRSMLQGKPQGKMVVQIVVADQGEAGVLAGLSGLLKTAVQENHHLKGQLILAPGETTTEELARRSAEGEEGGGGIADPI